MTLSCDPIPFSYAGTRTAIVITGGLGSLSLETSTWLARHGSIDIRLLSRAGRGKITHELRNCSGVVTIDRADTSSLEECANVFADVSTGAINSHRLPAGSLIHAAGILRDAMLVRQKMDSVLDVFGAKSSTIVRLKSSNTTCAVICNRVVFLSCIAHGKCGSDELCRRKCSPRSSSRKNPWPRQTCHFNSVGCMGRNRHGCR